MKRYTIADNGYKYDKIIIYIALGLWICFLGFIMYDHDFDLGPRLYYHCKQEVCVNPFIDTEISYSSTSQFYQDPKSVCTYDWCNQTLLTKGTYGEKPSILLDYFTVVGIILVILALFFNHFIHNKGKAIQVRLGVSNKVWHRIKKICEGLEDEENNNKK